MNEALRPLLYSQLKAEFEQVHKPAILINALRGIASCGTNCKCCRMHQEIATEALRKFDAIP